MLQFTSNDLFCYILAIPSNVLLMTLSRQLIDYEIFLVGYMGYTIEEVTSVNLSQTYVRGLKVDASLSCDDRITVDRLLVGLVIVM